MRPIDRFSLNFFKTQYTYNDFILEKESKTNQAILPSEGSDFDLDEGLVSEDSEEDNKISKMDMEEAYKLYLSKKQEISNSLDIAN